MSVLLDEDTIVLEGLEFEIPCVNGGDHAAELSFGCRFCPQQGFLCREHWKARRRIVDDYLAVHPGSTVVCAMCRTSALCLDDLVRVVWI